MPRKKPASSMDAGFARTLAGVADVTCPAELGERQENGLVKPVDDLKERLVVPHGGSITVQKPIPRGDKEVSKSAKGLQAKQAWARFVQADIDSGEFQALFERFKAKAKGGDLNALKEYFDRAMGKTQQNVAVAAEVQMRLSDEDRQVLEGLQGLFGVKKPEIVAEAKVVQ